MRAKIAQEELIEAAGQPYTIVRSTQFMEFLRAAADAATEGDTVRVPDANLQPIAAVDVAAAVTDAAHAPDRAVFNNQAGHFGVGHDSGAVRAGRQGVLEHESFGEFHLGIEVQGAGAEAQGHD